MKSPAVWARSSLSKLKSPAKALRIALRRVTNSSRILLIESLREDIVISPCLGEAGVDRKRTLVVGERPPESLFP